MRSRNAPRPKDTGSPNDTHERNGQGYERDRHKSPRMKNRYRDDFDSYTTRSSSWFDSDSYSESNWSSSEASTAHFSDATEETNTARSELYSTQDSRYYSTPSVIPNDSSLQSSPQSIQGRRRVWQSFRLPDFPGHEPRSLQSPISAGPGTSVTSFPSRLVMAAPVPPGDDRTTLAYDSGTGVSTIRGTSQATTSAGTSTGYYTVTAYEDSEDSEPGSSHRSRSTRSGRSSQHRHYPLPSGTDDLWSHFPANLMAVMASARDLVIPGLQGANYQWQQSRERDWSSSDADDDDCDSDCDSDSTMSSIISEETWLSANSYDENEDSDSSSITHFEVRGDRRGKWETYPRTSTPRVRNPGTASSRDEMSDVDSTVYDSFYYDDTSRWGDDTLSRSEVDPGTRS